MMLTLLLIGMLILAFDVQPVKASGTIYIRPDGSIDPHTTPIQRDGDIYIFYANIYDSIVVEKSNIMIDGNGYTLEGSGSGEGFSLDGVTNVSITRTNIQGFYLGIFLNSSSGNAISGNQIKNNGLYGIVLEYSSNNVLSGNNVVYNGVGIDLSSWSINNTLSGNNIANNYGTGVMINWGSNINTLYGNNITRSDCGVYLFSSDRNKFYHNNFVDNFFDQVSSWYSYPNVWDNGCEGNYWSDYNGTDLDGDGIGDTELPWLRLDHYPLMNPYWNPADVDHDLDVDLYDAVMVCVAYGSKLGDERYNPHCDIAEPYETITLYDVVVIMVNYGKEFENP